MALPLPRSYLFAPGHKPNLFAKAAATDADLVVLDLEDAVPQNAKAEARASVAAWLDGKGPPVAVRINGTGTEWIDEDLRLCAHRAIAAVIVPKVEDADPLRAVTEALGPGMPVLPMIESALGLHRALDIAGVPGVQRLVFGSLDFQADLGIPDDDLGLQFARSQLVLSSRVAGAGTPVDGVTRRFDEPGPVEAQAARARALGFGAKLCIHPRQVPWVNAAFSPTSDDVAWAEGVIDADASASGGVTAGSDGMIDRPVMLRARAILARARRTGGQGPA